MKHFTLLLYILVSSFSFAQQIDVTFRVDMQYQSVSSDGVHIAGSIQGWNPSTTPLSDDDGNGIWEVTLSLTANSYYEYKFINGNSWGNDESVFGNCGPGNGNRFLNTSDENMVLNAYVFNSCDYTAYGCTDQNATNFDSSANNDDGSCIYPVVTGCTDQTACNYNSSATDSDNSLCLYAQSGYDCDGECLESNVEWIGDKNNDGFVSIDPNTGDIYITIESYPNLGSATININGQEFSMNYTDWGSDAHWYYSIPFNNNTSYDWSVTVSNICNNSQTYSDSFSTGCTDLSACNTTEGATFDDGSCTYAASNADCDGNCLTGFTSVDGSCVAIVNGCTDATACNHNSSANVDDNSCTYAASNADCDGNCLTGFTSVDGSCVAIVNGCTDATAINYDTSANIDDGSCEFIDNPCDFIPSGLNVNNIIHNRVTFNWDYGSDIYPSDYAIRFKAVDDSNWTVITMEGSTADSLPNSQTSRTRWFMQPGTTYEWNVRSRVLNGDNSIFCQSSWSTSGQFTTLDSCPNMENLSVSTEAVWATFSADTPSSGNVWQSRGKMREIGTNSFRYAFGDTNGNINVTKGNFEASTDYEWHTKAWCIGNVDDDGNSDPMYHSGWGEFYPFTTQDPCDKMPTNLTTVTANFSQSVITMSWDTPITGEPDHYFLHLTHLETGQVFAWNNISGSANSKTKYNLSPGEYSWKIRGACGTNGTSWATPFSANVYHTLGGAKLENNSIANLKVYPNPSRDIFNISFNSDEKQTLSIKIINTIGKEIFTEKLTEFIGHYTKVIDMNTQSKGIYFFEITTTDGVINKKMILQ